jgi:hypothetical protein
MIAICPSCHDAAHHGSLKITDEVLYVWKGIKRPNSPDTVQIFVEPARDLKLLTGTICLSTKNEQLTVFEFSNSNRLKIRVLDGDMLQVNSRLQNRQGKEVLRVVENHVRVARDKEVEFEFRAGRARITVPATEKYIPKWIIAQMQVEVPSFAADGRLIALDLEVLKPGVLRVQGFWPSERGAIIVTPHVLAFCQPGVLRPQCIAGEVSSEGIGPVLMFEGSITTAMFGLG